MEPLWKKHRLGELPLTDTSILISEFEADYFGTAGEPRRFMVVSVTPQLLDDAARLVARHGLRTYDAVQLASAYAAQLAAGENIHFAAYDKALRSAAVLEGLDLLTND